MATSTFSYRSYVGAQNISSTTFTTTLDIGTAYSTRRVWFVGSIYFNDNAVASSSTLTVTIGGVTATCLAEGFGGITNYQVWTAAVPTGVTATLAISHASRVLNSIIGGIYLYTPVSLTPYAVGTYMSNMPINAPIGITDLPAIDGGAVMAYGLVYGYGLQNFGSQAFAQDFQFSNWKGWSLRPNNTSTTNDVYSTATGSNLTGQYIAISLDVDAKVPVQLTTTVTEGVGVAQTNPTQSTYYASLTEAPQLSDTPAYIAGINLSYETLTDGLGVASTGSVFRRAIGGVADLILTTSSVGYPFLLDTTDNIVFSEIPASSTAVMLTAEMGLHEAELVYNFAPGSVIEEGIDLSEIILRAVHYDQAAGEILGVKELLRYGVPVGLTDTIATQLITTVARGVGVIERLGLTSVIAPMAQFGITVSNNIRVTDVLLRFFAGLAVDGIGVQDASTSLRKAGALAADAVGVAESLTKKLVVRIAASETVGIDDVDVLKLLYNPSLADGVQLSAAYISPGSSVTTWAINTKNLAVTEYTNYNFNSFAHMGHKYLGAADTGLYELNGDTDQGTNIVADIKSGLMQLGGSRFSSFKAAYIGQRGTGDYVLKVETGDGKTYNYAVVGKDMQTARVHFGKGLRARYFSFELISAGQDFDLDTVEFIPLVAQRRV